MSTPEPIPTPSPELLKKALRELAPAAKAGSARQRQLDEQYARELAERESEGRKPVAENTGQ